MGNYNFKIDLMIANKTEKKVAKLLRESYDYKIIEKENTKKYDYLLLSSKGNKIKIEIKEDFFCKKSHNVAVEYASRGKLSGISTTQADVYIYVIHKPNGEIVCVWYPISVIKRMIEKEMYRDDRSGGDKGSNTRMYLFYYQLFIKQGTILALDKNEKIWYNRLKDEEV